MPSKKFHAICLTCKKEFKQEKRYNKHVKKKECIRCEHCGFFFKRQGGLDKHIDLLRCKELKPKDVGTDRVVQLILGLQKKVSKLEK